MNTIHATARRIALLLALLPGVTIAGEHPPRTYTWFTIDQPSGSQTVESRPDGGLSVRFEYNDRGRGPQTLTDMKVEADGRLSAFSARGLNYTKGAFEENFSVQDGRARWRSALEQGDAPASGSHIYYPSNPPPEYRAVLARALLAQPGRSLDLLPSGNARIEAVDSLTLAVDGTSRTATLYAIFGLDLTPVHVWLDQDQELVGYASGWFAVLRDDWKPHLATIRSAQEQALAQHIVAEAERFRLRIDAPIAITHVRVLDTSTGTLGAPATVLLRDGTIAAIGPVDLALPPDTVKVDGGGRTMMATLWDMHSHIGPDDYLHYIASGVLNVRDMGNDPAYLVQLRADIAAGTLAAPDVHPVGFIDQRGPFAAPTGRLVGSQEEALSAVHAYAKEGHRGIKLYSSLDPAWVPRLAREAHGLGLGTMGHVPSGMSTEQAIHAGYSEVTHINMLLLELIGDWSIDTRTPQRFIVPGERGGDIDLDSARARALIDLMLERGTAHDPTLSIFMDQYRSRPGEVAPRATAYADHLPAGLRRSHIQSTGYNDGKEAAFRRSGEVALQLVRRMHERGIRILPGTDTSLPGFALVSELEYYAEAGITRADVLRLATLETARHVGKADELGSIEVGKRAHLMLVEGDPTQDLGVLRKVRLVVKGDTLFDPEQILAAQGIRPFQ